MELAAFCQCGCGNSVAVHRGRPRRFVHGHNTATRPQRPPCACGCGQPVRSGRTRWLREHRAYQNRNLDSQLGYVRRGSKWEHILIAERALGRPLPDGAQVHHVNEDRADNRNRNLVICQDSAYHQLLHVRANALRATGSVHARRCRYCRAWIMPEDPTAWFGPRYVARHRACHAAAERARFAERRSA